MKQKDLRIEALKRFAAAITALNIAGHFFLGFEQSIGHMLAALATAYSMEIVFELIHAKTEKRQLKFAGGFGKFVIFLLPAHISALAVSMLIFTNEGLMPVIFATAVAILSKVIFRVKINNVPRHFLNPSNTGIATSLLLFPWIGIAQPYQFTESVTGYVDWMLPVIFIGLGSFLNAAFTKRIPLIIAWLAGFVFQAALRSVVFNGSVIASILPMSGVAFLLFTFYMISDPATTPMKRNNQMAFGFSVACVYGSLVSLHIVFGLFFALFIVCVARGVYLYITPFIVNQPIHSATGAEVKLANKEVVIDGSPAK